MPASSETQRKYIFSLRGKYKTQSATPKKYKFIWDKGWENKGKLPEKVEETKMKKLNEYEYDPETGHKIVSYEKDYKIKAEDLIGKVDPYSKKKISDAYFGRDDEDTTSDHLRLNFEDGDHETYYGWDVRSLLRKLNLIKESKMKNLMDLLREAPEETVEPIDHTEPKQTDTGTANELKLTSILKTIKKTDSELTNEQKRQFVKAVEAYNEIAPFVYRDADTMKAITQSMLMIARITEQLVSEKADDWMDLQTVKKDVKSINDSAKQFEKTAQEIMQLQHRLESIFEDTGTKLNKYFLIKDVDINPKGSTEKKIKVAPEKKTPAQKPEPQEEV